MVRDFHRVISLEALFARAIRRLGFLFPTEIIGLVVLMVPIGVIPVAFSKFLGITYHDEPISTRGLTVALVTLFAMVAVNVWGRGPLRLFSALVGMVAGYGLSLATGVLAAAQLEPLSRAPWLAIPRIEGMTEIAFRWSLLPAFLIVSVTGALKSMGNLIMCEKVNDADWKAPDLTRIGGGLLADSVAVTCSGLLGGVASDTSASNVALSRATGATSRFIGYAAGGLFALLAFSPRITGLLSVMPAPVMGAILLFVVSVMVISGMQIILASEMDTRRTLTVGIALVFGLSLDMVPGFYAGIPGWLHPLFESSLTLSTVIAVALNQVLRPRSPGTSSVGAR